MKIILLFLTLFTAINLSDNNYLTKKEEFINTVSNAYETYYIENLDNATGELSLVIGSINGVYSFSVFYHSKVSKSYNIDIYDNNKDKLFVLSDYEDYQIYYNIPINNDSSYNLEINSNTNNTYMSYLISNIHQEYNNKELINGTGNNLFPYNTVLKNQMSDTWLYIILVVIFIIIEIIIFIIIKKGKNKNQNINVNVNNSYNNVNNHRTLNYVILDDEKVDNNENK